MGERADSAAERPPSRNGRPAIARVLLNAGLLAFASLAVISVASGHVGAALLWAGALFVFFAPALDSASGRPGWLTRRADGLRWCGLALAAAGAALLLI